MTYLMPRLHECFTYERNMQFTSTRGTESIGWIPNNGEYRIELDPARIQITRTSPLCFWHLWAMAKTQPWRNSRNRPRKQRAKATRVKRYLRVKCDQGCAPGTIHMQHVYLKKRPPLHARRAMHMQKQQKFNVLRLTPPCNAQMIKGLAS